RRSSTTCAPVARSRAPTNGGGYVILSRYEDVVAASRDDATFTSELGITVPGLPSADFLRLSIGIDPPQAFKYRNILMRFFRASWLQALQPWVDDFVDAQIDTFIESGRGDLQSGLAHPLTANFIMHVTGLPRELWWEYSAPVIGSIGSSRDEGTDESVRLVTRTDTSRMLSAEIDRQRASPIYSPDEKVLP